MTKIMKLFFLGFAFAWVTLGAYAAPAAYAQGALSEEELGAVESAIAEAEIALSPPSGNCSTPHFYSTCGRVCASKAKCISCCQAFSGHIDVWCTRLCRDVWEKSADGLDLGIFGEAGVK